LNDQWDFRQELQQLGKLAFAETQMLLLTATLPPTEEQTLFDRMYWQRAEVRLIRVSTVRKNIEYSVIDGPAERVKRMKCLSSLVEGALRDESQPDGKVVVMCKSKPEISAIVEARLFPCEPFHADMAEERKEEVLEEFWTGQIQVVVASGSFNMGIDIAGIRLIIHMDEPRNIRDYGQGSRRAGRDGLASRAIIIRGSLGLGDDRVKQYVNRERRQCRRIDIDGYLDGDRTRQRCRADESWCDWCQEQGKSQQLGSREGVQAAVEAEAIEEEDRRIRREVAEQARQRSVPQARRIGHIQRQAAWYDGLARRLERWKGICVMCQSRDQASTYSISRCVQEHSQQAEEERRGMQRSIKYAANVVCYKCGVPNISRQTNDHDSFAFVWAFTLRVCMINYDSFAFTNINNLQTFASDSTRAYILALVDLTIYV
jgi:superfamily II DNA helicase RecQ